MTRHFRFAWAVAAIALVGATATPIVSAATAGPGSLDTTFNNGGAGADKSIDVLQFGADDSIYIAGGFTTYNGTAVPGLARLKSDGSLDTTFNVGTGADDDIEAIAEMPDGDVYVAGTFNNFNGKKADRLVRLNKDGSVDEAFVSAGFKHLASQLDHEYPRVILPTSDGKIIVSGYWDQYGGTYSDGGDYVSGAVKLNADGTIDKTFNARFIGQSFTTGYATDMVYNADKSKITAIGTFMGYGGSSGNDATFITRFGNDGVRDYSLDVTTVANGSNNYIQNLAQTSDGKYYIAGNFSKWKDVEAKYLIRINADGTRDTTFPSPSAIAPNNMAIDSQDRLYLAGRFIAYNGTPAKGLVRIKPDGSIDTSFDTSNGSGDVTITASGVQSTFVAISPAGKVYVYGPLEQYGGTTIGHIARIISASKPGAVTDVKVTVSGTTATVTWKLPTDGDAPETITVTATEVSSSGVRSSASSGLSCTVPGTATTCNIEGLVKGKSYTFKVTTSNGGGSSSPVASQPISVGSSSPATTSSAPALPATGSASGDMAATALLLLALGLVLRGRRFARN